MPRGKRKPALQKVEEQIAAIDSEIQDYKTKINELQDQKKGFLEQQKKLQLEELYSTIQESGKSVEEILKLAEAK